jgi:SAM-dependent methyltransferase
VLCAASDGHHVVLRAARPAAGDVLDVVRCGACRSMWYPDAEAMHDYPDADRLLANPEFLRIMDHYLELVAGLDWKAPMVDRLPRGTNARVLEVGCNVGGLLDYIRTAWSAEVVGLEPSVYGRFGATDLGLPILPETMDEALERSSLRPGSFDVVIAAEVIEHVDHPMAFLRSMRSLVSDDGVVLLTTPNPDGVVATAPTGHLDAALSVGAHRFLVAPEQLASMARHAGFGHVVSEPDGISQRAVLAVQPVALAEPRDAARALAAYHRAVTTSATRPRRRLGAAMSAAIIERRDLGSLDPELERTIDDGLVAQCAVDCRAIGRTVAASSSWERIFDIGATMPYHLPTYLYWRGQRDDLSEQQRTDLWEAAGVLALRMMRVDPVNNFLIGDIVPPVVAALSGRLPGPLRAELTSELRGSAEHAHLVIRPASWSRRTRAGLGALRRRLRPTAG